MFSLHDKRIRRLWAFDAATSKGRKGKMAGCDKYCFFSQVDKIVKYKELLHRKKKVRGTTIFETAVHSSLNP